MSAILYLTILCILLYGVHTVFRLKWIFNVNTNTAVTSWNDEFNELPKNSIDVLFLGSSHSYYTVSPILIWKRTQIPSYSLGSPSLRANVANEILKRALKTQAPKYVFLEAYSLAYPSEQTTQYLHYTFDSWNFSFQKYKAIERLTSDDMVSERNELMLPLLQYHGRWREINMDDVRYLFRTEETRSLRGHRIDTRVTTEAKLDGSLSNDYMQKDMEQFNKKALNEFAALCRANNITPVVWAAPSSAWNSRYSSFVGLEATELGIEFIDFNEKGLLESLGIDETKHFSDPHHLNEAGANIINKYLSSYLKKQNITPRIFSDRELLYWDSYVKYYSSIHQERKLSQAKKASKFITAIDTACCTIFVANKDPQHIENENMLKYFEKMGIQSPISVDGDSFFAVIEGGKITEYTRDTTSRKLQYKIGKDRYTIQVAVDQDGPTYNSIIANGKELLPKRTGMGIVVYDHLIEDVISAVVLQVDSGQNKIYHK